MMLATQSPYKELCKSIIRLNQYIRFAGIINDRGRLVTGAARDKITFLVNDKSRELLFMEVALHTSMSYDFDAFLGEANFSIHHRKNVIVIEFPIKKGTMYVTAEKEINLNNIPFEIAEILRKDALR